MFCPICKRPVEEPREQKHTPTARPAGDDERSYFPFCSERCKLIDLGRWLGGKYQIPVVERDGSGEEAPPAEDLPGNRHR